MDDTRGYPLSQRSVPTPTHCRTTHTSFLSTMFTFPSSHFMCPCRDHFTMAPFLTAAPNRRYQEIALVEKVSSHSYTLQNDSHIIPQVDVYFPSQQIHLPQ